MNAMLNNNLSIKPSNYKFLLVCWFPSSRYCRYTQVSKTRHSGMDRRNPDYRDVHLRVGTLPEPNTCATYKLPSMALDSCIPAGMTAVLVRRNMDIALRVPAWTPMQESRASLFSRTYYPLPWLMDFITCFQIGW